jgi:hypothetical protein
MRDDSPFALAGIWENWQHPETQEWVRTFCIITTTANELVPQTALSDPKETSFGTATEPQKAH